MLGSVSRDRCLVGSRLLKLILAPITGVVTDRVDKRKLLLLAQSMLVVTNSMVAVLIITGEIEFWHLRVVYLVSSAAFAFNMPARGALVALLVPRDKLMNAIAINAAAMNASRIVAPPMAGDESRTRDPGCSEGSTLLGKHWVGLGHV